jgi:hypothetical protein|eukprot:SAG25_NODE_1220_length_3576_cov_2.680184_4_plen_83_part_00
MVVGPHPHADQIITPITILYVLRVVCLHLLTPFSGRTCVPCRYLVAKCHVMAEEWEPALAVLGDNLVCAVKRFAAAAAAALH